MTYMDRTNPNLVVVLHYLSKTSWLALAAFFGYIGLRLYALGIRATGSGQFDLWGLKMTLDNAGPGLIVMVVSLLSALAGAVRAKVQLRPCEITLAAPVRHSEPARNSPETSTGILLLDGTTVRTFSQSHAAIVLNSAGIPIVATASYQWLGPELSQRIVKQVVRIFGRDRAPGDEKAFAPASSPGAPDCSVKVQLMAPAQPIGAGNSESEGSLPFPTHVAGYLVGITLTGSTAKREFASRDTQYPFPTLPYVAGDAAAADSDGGV